MYHENFQFAFADELMHLMAGGEKVTVRGSTTMEMLMHSFTVDKPDQRVAIVKHRNANIFAQIAETFWMLAGRCDMDFLEFYIPKARTWSDDGETWRGAYGPRLRHWEGHPMSGGPHAVSTSWTLTDQLQEVYQRLVDDRFTRQAIISIWDPARDNIKGSKDYPCNDWLHFIVRDDKLHLNVAVRSNDIMFGFSHVDFFGWSVLLQLMASWLNVQVGQITWNATSFHIYERHWDKATKILGHGKLEDYYIHDTCIYDYGYTVPRWETPFVEFDYRLNQLMVAEESARNDDWSDAKDFFMDTMHPEDMLHWATAMLLIYIAHKQYKAGESTDTTLIALVLRLIDAMPDIDFRIAAIEYFSRVDRDLFNAIALREKDEKFLRAYGVLS